MGGILRLAACVVGYSNHFLRTSISYLWVVALSRWTQYDQLTQLVATMYHNNRVATMMRA